MEPKGHLPYYENLDILAEVELRGRFMMMACDLEWQLFSIMIYCNVFDQKKTRKYKGMMMAKKIDCTIADLKKYNLDYYSEFKDAFDSLEEFKKLRNYFGHNRMRFEEAKHPSNFSFFYIDESNGAERIHQKSYTMSEMLDAIKRFRKLQQVFMTLVGRLQEEAISKYAS